LLPGGWAAFRDLVEKFCQSTRVASVASITPSTPQGQGAVAVFGVATGLPVRNSSELQESFIPFVNNLQHLFTLCYTLTRSNGEPL